MAVPEGDAPPVTTGGAKDMAPPEAPGDYKVGCKRRFTYTVCYIAFMITLQAASTQALVLVLETVVVF